MPIVFSESKPAVTSSQLDALQQRLHIELPESYRKFLLTNNGGRPQPSLFNFILHDGRREGSSIQFFFGVYEGKYSNLERSFSALKIRAKRLPDELIPIANDEYGNYVCLAISGKQKGAVFFWDHENENEEENEPWWENVHLIKPTFQEFLDSLH